MKIFRVLLLAIVAFTASAEQFVVTCGPTSGWSCSVAVDAKEAATVDLANCFVPRRVSLPAGGVFLENVTGLNCFSAPFQLLSVPDTVTGSTVARYAGGMTLSFPSNSSKAGTLRAAPIVSSGEESTFILAFNRSPGRAFYRVHVHDGQNQYVATEPLSVEGWAFYRIDTPVSVGSIYLQPGSGVGAGGADSGEVIFWVFVGPAGGNAAPRVIVPEVSPW